VYLVRSLRSFKIFLNSYSMTILLCYGSFYPTSGLDFLSSSRFRLFRIILIHFPMCLSSVGWLIITASWASYTLLFLSFTTSLIRVLQILIPSSSFCDFEVWSTIDKYSWTATRNFLRSNFSMILSIILLSLRRHLMINPGSFGIDLSSLYFFRSPNNVQKI